MASEAGRSAINIKDELLNDGRRFSFFQTLRLLRFMLHLDSPDENPHDYLRESVRIRPKLSLAHPSADIDKIEQITSDPQSFLITVTILGLYGESSPLPTFYTEELIEEDLDDKSVTRDFMDIINYPLHLLFFRCWTKYRTHLKVVDERDPKYLEILFSLMGLGVDDVRGAIKDPYKLLKYMGLFSQMPKSSLGLKALLSDALEEPRLEIIPCIKRKVRIPDDQRLQLGVQANCLGVEAYLGEEIDDRMSKFRVKVGPVDVDGFQQMLPDTEKYEKCQSLIKLYLMEPLVSDLEIVLERNQAQSARLGEGNWSRLGLDTWIFSGDLDEQVNTIFELT